MSFTISTGGHSVINRQVGFEDSIHRGITVERYVATLGIEAPLTERQVTTYIEIATRLIREVPTAGSENGVGNASVDSTVTMGVDACTLGMCRDMNSKRPLERCGIVLLTETGPPNSSSIQS